jgi:hypothetical protein
MRGGDNGGSKRKLCGNELRVCELDGGGVTVIFTMPYDQHGEQDRGALHCECICVWLGIALLGGSGLLAALSDLVASCDEARLRRPFHTK